MRRSHNTGVLMHKLLVVVAALALFVAACSGSGSGGVASLDETADDAAIVEDGVSSSESDEDMILAFSACMRENGVEGFEDPDFNADGSLGFRGGGGDLGDVDRETMRAAFEACQEHLEGLALGPGSIDFTEIEDRLLEFSTCMRENGYDMPDPDFSNFGAGGGGGGEPFGGEIDRDDPGFQAALEACEHIFEGFELAGRGGGGPRGGGG